ncbi:probable multidrug resistance-associated protein lethal(2)03659 isoform X2 [Cylas formicarius]|uniref:probable multidrug resistance-associated protein lethal(2)03659 isoform X2 n=1 Tax=Cylas formicarius TaxID=197179 RepID=UPI00295863A5|nr:probable multidrug resistance-associated protein lethal(2)03659 isoform X2 [Cylas formicarius]
MDNTAKYPDRPNPLRGANPISELMFFYMFPIFKKSYKKQLTEDDLFSPLRSHNSCILGQKLETIWKEEHRKRKKSALHFALLKMFGLHFFILGLIQLVNEVLYVTVIPLAIGKLVRYFEVNQTVISENEAYYYCGIIVVCLIIDAYLVHPRLMSQQHLSMKMRVACSSLIYRKALRLSKTALGKTTVGQMVNLLSNDLSRFDQSFVLAHFAWVGPIQVAVGTWLLYREIGMAALFGVIFLLSFVPLQGFLAKRTSVLRLRTALRTDERVRLMNEVISGIQVIKMYCWEQPFSKLVAFARKKEMNAIRGHAYIVGLIYSFEVFVSRTSIFLSILGYVLLGNYVTAEKVFSITAIYNALRPVITILFSISISSLAEVNISVLRVQKFLSYDEIGDKEVALELSRSKSLTNGSLDHYGSLNGTAKGIKASKLALCNVYAKWSDDVPEDTLKNVSLCVNSNQLLAVIGPVGSGKSSLINAILNELPVKYGQVEINGVVSYASQEPWLFSGSVKHNILFGEDYDEERYNKVVHVCALLSDFEMLPYGDKTLVGEKGKSLSGGQKARINLARCIYKKADIYLLDDPLSAVDANVGKHLFEKCIQDFLKDKIRILVTHQLQYLQNADKIIIMNNGQIQIEGKYEQLQSSGVNFGKLLKEFSAEEVEENKKKKIRSRQNSAIEEQSQALVDADGDAPEMEKEVQGTGGISKSLYWQYFRAGGNICSIVFMAFLFLGCQAVANGAEYFVTYWVNMEQDYAEKIGKQLTNATLYNSTSEIARDQIFYIYAGLTAGTIAVAVLKSIYFMVFFTLASTNLHNFIFSKIIRAKMRFYNTNSSGRILNRFSKDMGNIDEYIPSVLVDVIEVALLLAGTVILTSIVEPLLLIPSFGLMATFYSLRLVYIETSRNVKRIESITKSPVFGHMAASVQGLSTIRAFGAQELLIKEFDELQNRHNAAWFLFIASSRCFAFWLDLFCILFIAVATFSLLALNKVVHGGDIGLVITQYLGLTGSLQWGMRQWSELENQMTSLERVLEYTKLESEPERSEETSIPADWPQHGAVQFKCVRLRYSEKDPYVLKGLNFVVRPQEKVGIVGRTGAGKSSTISALFQLYDIEGSIVIDGIDTTTLPLEKVRSRLSIIPQEPVLFSGTMRKNLDPFEEYSDDVLWDALAQVELKDMICHLPAGLNSNVSEGGTNFSVGQRQLVCLARALIRNNKILVLDEATANVDPHTDALIQTTIRNKFGNCTVFTIAHRLHTVMDSDKILVMSGGSVIEFDHPYILLKKEGGILRKLIEDTGKSMSRTLENIAKENFLRGQVE